MSDINNLYNNLTNFYNVNDENFKEFMAKLYDEMKANHRDVKYVKEHLPEEIEKKLGVIDYGTTSERPTTNLQCGMMFFDTTLNKPIWRNKDNNGWVDAMGTSV